MTTSPRSISSLDPLVELIDISRTFPGSPEVRALRTMSLNIHAGDFLMIEGPSGSGKSTFLNVLGLLDRPSSGRYLLEGQDVSDLGEEERSALRGQRIGFVFQSLNLLNSRSSYENVLLATAYQGLSSKASEKRVVGALASVGLANKADVTVSKLSGGEKQRVAIARALAGDPAILLCDEPTGNLDSGNSQEVLNLLLQLNNDGVTIILITHNPDIARHGSRQATIRDGELTETLRT